MAGDAHRLLGGSGWLNTIRCRVCGDVLAEKDQEVDHG